MKLSAKQLESSQEKAREIAQCLIDNEITPDNANYETILSKLIEYIAFVVSEHRKHVKTTLRGLQLEKKAADYFDVPTDIEIIDYIISGYSYKQENRTTADFFDEEEHEDCIDSELQWQEEN